MRQAFTREELSCALEAEGGKPGAMTAEEYADRVWRRLVPPALSPEQAQDEAAVVVHEALSLIEDTRVRMVAAGYLPDQARQVVRRAWEARGQQAESETKS